MCWNQEVSFNTFFFSSFVLLLIVYNNNYTKYKIDYLNNIWVILFLLSFIFMQLIEFFIWKNIKNKYYNNLFSILACCLIIIQPIASIMILQKIDIRNNLLLLYLLLVIPYSIYKFSTKHIYSDISKKGHLRWDFFNANIIFKMIWLFFLLVPFVYQEKWYTILFAILTLLIIYYNYKEDNTTWSLWCWVINSFMLFFAFYLLFYLPFRESKETDGFPCLPFTI